VRDGREALFTFRHEQPDLVILDVMMPEMNGWEAARMIRTGERGAAALPHSACG
jgi:CheY-like chemotaxis protein